MTTDDRIKNLPKWAQKEITRLRLEIVRLKEQQHQIDAGETNISYIVLPDVDKVQHLPDFSVFRFQLPDGLIDVTLGTDGLHISSSSGLLVIRPQVANSIRVTQERI